MTEWMLLGFLILAIGYIIYKEQGPRNDAERRRRDAADERLSNLK